MTFEEAKKYIHNKPTKKDIVPPVEDDTSGDLEDKSKPAKTKAYMAEVSKQALSDYEPITDMEVGAGIEDDGFDINNATSSVLEGMFKAYDKGKDVVENIGRGAGKNLSRYSAALNDGVSKALDVANPYTWVTGNKTDLSNFFKKAAEKNRELYNEWDKNSDGSKVALASEFILDPALVLPTGVATTGSKLARMGKSALAGAGIGGGLSFIKDYGAGGTGFENMGLGAGSGAGVNAVIAGLTRGKAPNLSGMVDEFNPNLSEKYSLKKEISQIGRELKDVSRDVKAVSEKARDKFIDTYKQKVMPLTASGRERLLKDDFRSSLMNNKTSSPALNIEDEIIENIPVSNYKVLNSSNIDEALYNKPTVLNTYDFERISNPVKKLQVQNRIKEINKQLKKENKNKSVDDIISEYEFKDSQVLNKEYEKIRKSFNKNFNAFRNNLKFNNELSNGEYIDMLNKYKENFFKTENGRKFNALKDELIKRLTKEPVEDYVSNKKIDNTYNNTSDVPFTPKALTNDITDIQYQAVKSPVFNEMPVNNTQTPINNIPALTGKNIELYDGDTGEIIEIPEEILEIIKKKALMNS